MVRFIPCVINVEKFHFRFQISMLEQSDTHVHTDSQVMGYLNKNSIVSVRILPNF